MPRDTVVEAKNSFKAKFEQVTDGNSPSAILNSHPVLSISSVLRAWTTP